MPRKLEWEVARLEKEVADLKHKIALLKGYSVADVKLAVERLSKSSYRPGKAHLKGEGPNTAMCGRSSIYGLSYAGVNERPTCKRCLEILRGLQRRIK